MKNKKLKKYLLPGLMIFFCIIFLVSAVQLTNRAMEASKQNKQNQQLANMVEQVQQQMQQEGIQRPPISSGEPDEDPYVEPDSAFIEIIHPDTGETIKVLREYAAVFELNTDMIGWIELPGTKLNYPVVQTPYEPNYYLKRDFYKKSSRYGTIYANEWANVFEPSDNVTLYGHNMNDGAMFGALHNYNDEEFYKANPYIYFDTIYEHHTYQVLAVFYTTDIVGKGFAYHTFIDGNAVSFEEFIDECKALSRYDTGVTATYGDKLLTLSTCDKDYQDDHGRFVVVAKRVS